MWGGGAHGHGGWGHTVMGGNRVNIGVGAPNESNIREIRGDREKVREM